MYFDLDCFYCYHTFILFGQAHTYKEDFERERRDRTELARTYDEEKAVTSVQHQTVVDSLQKDIQELEGQVELQQRSKQKECSRLQGEIERLNEELTKVKEQNDKDKDALQIALGEKQSLEDAHSTLDNKYREKEAKLEKVLAHKSDLEEQLKKSRKSHKLEADQFQFQLEQMKEQFFAERANLEQQIARANEEVVALDGQCQSKKQQVKQYKKKIDGLELQIDNLTAKIAEYEQQLGYYQEQVRILNEDVEQKVTISHAHITWSRMKSILSCRL